MSGSAKPKIGADHVASMGRIGFKEISRYLVAFPENPGIIEDPGGSGNSGPNENQSSKGFDARAQDAAQQSRPRTSAQKEPELER